MAQQGRVQAPDFKNTLRLQPAARPVDTFEAPAAIPEDRSTERLLTALSSFGNVVGNTAPILGAAAGRTNKDANQAALAERENFFMRASPEEKRAYIIQKHGLDQADKIQAAAIGKMDGGQFAEMVQTELQQEMQTFDWANGDPEAFAKEYLQKKLQESGRMGEPTFVSAYSQAGQGFALNVVNQREKILAEKRSDDATRAASYYAKSAFTDGIKAGDAPDVVAKKFLATEPGMGPRGPLMLDDNAAAKIQLDELERQAANPASAEAVMAALAMERPGKGGARKSFRDDALTTDRAVQIYNTAAATQRHALNAAEKDALTAHNVKLIEDGTGFLGARDLVQTKLAVNGGTSEEVYTVEQQKNDAIRMALQKDDRKARELGETPVQTLTRRTLTMAAAGVENPDIKVAADGLAEAASPDVIQNPEAKQKLLQRIDLMRTVQGANKNIAASYLKGQDKDFFEGFTAAREVLGWDDDRAVTFAYRVTNPPAGARSMVLAQRNTIDTAMMELHQKGWFASVIGPSSMSNSGEMEQKVVDMAEMYVKAGMNGKDAVKVAAKAFNDNAILFNGTYVDLGNVASRSEMPADFNGAVTAQVDAFMDRSKNHGYNRGDITIQQIGTRDGRFVLIDKNTGAPLADDEGHPQSFTLSNLRAWDNANRTLQSKQRETYSAFTQSVNAKGLAQVLDKEGSSVWVDKKRTIWENTAPEGETPVWKNTGKRVNASAVLVSPSGVPQLQRPDALNQKLKVTSEFFSRMFSPSPRDYSGANPDPASRFLNDQSKAVTAITGAIGNAINGSQGFIKVGKEAEKAINERNHGR